MTGRDLLAKILPRVQVDAETGCWIYQGARSVSGGRRVAYGVCRIGRRVWRLNRLVLLLVTGPIDCPRIPGEAFESYLERLRQHYHGVEASHQCDRSLCVYPHHLAWQDHRANVQDQRARQQESRR